MVSWWPGDRDTIDIQDSNNGTLQNGVAFASGMVDQAFSFDASLNAGVLIPSSPALNPTEAVTIDAWVKPFSFPNAFAEVVRKDQENSSVPQYELAVTNTGQAHCDIGGFGNPVAGSVPLNQWSHLACTYDRQAVRLYVNGIEVASFAATQAIPTATTNLAIGKEDGSTVRNFDGLIDEVEIFNRALTASEIQAIVNAGSAGKCKPPCTLPPSGMVSWWPGDGDANDIQDNNNGTLQNGVTFAAGKVGQAFSFDGVNDFVDIPTSNGLSTSTWTIDFWFFLNTNTTSQAFVTNFDGSGSRYVIEFHTTLGLRIGHFTSGVPDLNSSFTPSAGAWHHLAAIQSTDPSIGQLLYLDGNSIGTAGASTADPTIHLKFGQRGDGTFFLNGLLDEVEIFNRDLSTTEIQAIVHAYSAGKCKSTPTPTPTSTPTLTPTPTPTPTPTATPSYAAQIQQPINADGTSVFSVRRGVIPVKFTLTQGGVATCNLPPATIAVTRTSGQTTGAIDESVYAGPADTGSNFRIDSCQYIYNLSASALGVGTYRVDIKINNQIVGSAIFQLK